MGSRAKKACYDWFVPRPALAPWLERLWVQQSPAAPGAPPTTVVPNGQAELIVCYGDPFLQVQAGGGVRRLPHVLAIGPRMRPLVVAATGATGLVIAGLHPWASSALLGDAASSFTDRIIDLADLIGRPRVVSLADRVGSASHPEERVRRVEDFLSGLFRHDPDALAVACTRQVSRRSGKTSVVALARELGVSERHLRRRVTSAVGIGPKRFSRLTRAHRAMTLLRSGGTSGEVAFSCGYVDRAHLTRELKRFTGRTPGELCRRGDETTLMRSFNRFPERCDAASCISTVYV